MLNHYRIDEQKLFDSLPVKFHYIDIVLIVDYLSVRKISFFLIYTYTLYSILHDNSISMRFLNEKNGSLYDATTF